MKRKMTMLTAICLTSTLFLLSGCATDHMAQCRQMMNSMGDKPEMMQQMMGGQMPCSCPCVTN